VEQDSERNNLLAGMNDYQAAHSWLKVLSDSSSSGVVVVVIIMRHEKKSKQQTYY